MSPTIVGAVSEHSSILSNTWNVFMILAYTCIVYMWRLCGCFCGKSGSRLWFHCLCVLMQVSDAVYRYVGPAQGYDTGKAVSMEFGLLITAIVMLLGGGAFLMSTLFVENDRRVRFTYVYICLL